MKRDFQKISNEDLLKMIEEREKQMQQLADSFHWDNRNKSIKKYGMLDKLHHNLESLKTEAGRRKTIDRLSGNTLPTLEGAFDEK